MSRHINLPFHLYINVDNKFLGETMPQGITPGIWHGIFSRSNQILMCHVLLETGANWSGLPIHALSTTYDFSYSQEQLSPWGAMGEDIDTYNSNYLEGLECELITHQLKSTGRHTGIIIDWKDGFSRYPQEHKPLNLLTLDNGQLGLFPNNYILYKDKHFTKNDQRDVIKHYKRGEITYWEK